MEISKSIEIKKVQIGEEVLGFSQTNDYVYLLVDGSVNKYSFKEKKKR